MKISPESAAYAFMQAINRQDVEALAALMTAEHRFIDSLGNVVAGRDTMRTEWSAYFRMIPDYSLAIDEAFCDSSVVMLVGIAEGTFAPDGVLKPENRWKTSVAIRVQVEDGRVAEWRVFADNEPIREHMRKAEG